ncbi:hypothetical protein BJ165DRAFT_224881 [Panaeolus papilionaceus]|nr:hypothetical protein BJ165DRAFT_224881 [Panaeolus papilionaceus]
METPSFVWEQLSADFAALAFDETRPCPKILLCFHHFFHLISNSAVGTAQREHLRCSFQRDHGANVLTDQSLSVETYDDKTMTSPWPVLPCQRSKAQVKQVRWLCCGFFSVACLNDAGVTWNSTCRNRTLNSPHQMDSDLSHIHLSPVST